MRTSSFILGSDTLILKIIIVSDTRAEIIFVKSLIGAGNDIYLSQRTSIFDSSLALAHVLYCFGLAVDRFGFTWRRFTRIKLLDLLVLCLSGGFSNLTARIRCQILIWHLAEPLTMKVVSKRIDIGSFLLYNLQRHPLINLLAFTDNRLTHLDKNGLIIAIILEVIMLSQMTFSLSFDINRH